MTKSQASKSTKALYLHGFASGPKSTKAQYFVDRLNQVGIEVVVPDLNKPAFTQMTLTSQLQIARQCLSEFGPDSELLVIGSSMGGLLATLLAQSLISIQALVLLAPGFGLPRRWSEMLGENGLLEWRETGYMDVFHYGLNDNARLDYNFIVDAEKYATDGFKVNVPTVVFHGKNDETVPVEESVAFKELNPEKVRLEILDDDHQLIKSLAEIWNTTEAFLNQTLA
ncbi:MAG: YqiA/YcfP family alpha/beta fold hydrolase [Candidatus Obscuribacterales bacterium]|nr:MAG: alpha/beta fold hydrolase [Candidatus Melainabacteria bacterium]